jgi:ABC-type transporter Mla subunit MlaD
VEPKTSLLNLLRGILPEEQAERVAPEMATLLGEMVQAEVARQLETLIRELRADYHRIDERLARLVQVTEQHSEQIARLVQVTEQHSEQIAERCAPPLNATASKSPKTRGRLNGWCR